VYYININICSAKIKIGLHLYSEIIENEERLINILQCFFKAMDKNRIVQEFFFKVAEENRIVQTFFHRHVNEITDDGSTTAVFLFLQ